MKIIGEGVISNGDYDDIKVVGQALADEGFKGNNLKVIGEIISKDMIKVLKGKIIGSISTKELDCNDFSLIGEFIGEKVTSEKAKILGSIESNLINTNELQVVTSELEIKEINADSVDIKNSLGNVDSIVGEKIKVYKKFTLKNRKYYQNILNVGEIEGDYIYLENVNAKKVSGNIVEIGPNCVIDELESNNKSIHKSSVVKEGGVNE